MQNLLVLLFPQLIDGLNAVLKTRSPKAKFWVAIITSVFGGIALNLTMFQQVLVNPNYTDVGWVLSIIALIVAATQGVYVKFWETHPARSAVFPILTPPVQPVAETVTQ